MWVGTVKGTHFFAIWNDESKARSDAEEYAREHGISLDNVCVEYKLPEDF